MFAVIVVVACCGRVPTFQSAGESVGRTHLVEPPQTKGVDGLLDRWELGGEWYYKTHVVSFEPVELL